MMSVLRVNVLARKARAFALLGVLSFCATWAIAEDANAQSAEECTNPQGQQMMNICAGNAYRAADAALNEAWKSAKSFADAIGQDTALLNAQRAWLAYRDAACEVHASPYEGGSLQPFIQATCLSRLTEARTAMLLEFNAY